MPITTFQNILSTDKLQSGFRAKFNANVALLITDIVDNGDATVTVELQGGTNFVVPLDISFYTKAEVTALIAAVQAAVWGAITGNVADQTDVVGNFGVIDNIDALLLSCNFAVASGDSDNPFGAFPASGFASFSVPGIAGTGWQLLIKEDNNSEIKFRTYYSGVWHDWVSIQNESTEFEYTGTSITIDWDTDFIYGATTFAEALGNNLPKPVLYFKDGNNYTDGNVVPYVVRVAGVISTVTFNWGYSTDVVIVF